MEGKWGTHNGMNRNYKVYGPFISVGFVLLNRE